MGGERLPVRDRTLHFLYQLGTRSFTGNGGILYKSLRRVGEVTVGGRYVSIY